jgi:hypothetical protein
VAALGHRPSNPRAGYANTRARATIPAIVDDRTVLDATTISSPFDVVMTDAEVGAATLAQEGRHSDMKTNILDRAATVAAMAVVVAVVAVGCGQPAPSFSPTISPGATATAAASPAVESSPTATAEPSLAVEPTPTGSPSSVACAFKRQTVGPPSDRLTGIEILGLAGKDIVAFDFGPESLSPAGKPTGSLSVATPPFTAAASGKRIALSGEHALKIVFTGMAVTNDLGEPTFSGERHIRVDDGRSLREVILFDESEGQIAWYIGFDGSPCVKLSGEGDRIIVGIEFAASS